MLAQVERGEMYRFGAAVREGDSTPELGRITMATDKGEKDFTAYGSLQLNPERTARILKFLEKQPKLTTEKVTNDGGLSIAAILSDHGVGALSPTNLQNGSIYAIRAELIEQLAPLVFSLSRNASALEWAESEAVNMAGPTRFSDFGGDWFMALTGSKPLPTVSEYSPIREEQERVLEDIRRGLPQIFGYKHDGLWADDGTLEAVLQGHMDILRDLATRGRDASWPIAWSQVKMGLPRGIVSFSPLELRDVTVNPPVFIGAKVLLHPGAVVGPNAVIGSGWEICGNVSNSVLFHKGVVDRTLESTKGWKRHMVVPGQIIEGSLVGSGFEPVALDQDGKVTSSATIRNAVVVSNGSQNVISSIKI